MIFYRIVKTALGSHALVLLFIDEDIRKNTTNLQHHSQNQQEILRQSELVNDQA
jgi:hypothetical protein